MTTYVRREVRSLGPDDNTLAEYARAITAMLGRKDSDPPSWKFQAAIHGTPVTPPPPG